MAGRGTRAGSDRGGDGLSDDEILLGPAPLPRIDVPDAREPAVAAVDDFATSFLADDAFPEPDLVSTGLVVDLATSPMVALDETESFLPLDPGGADLLEGNLPGDVDGDGIVDR